MGVFRTIAKATIKRVVRHVTKHTIKKLAVRGAKEVAKGAALAGVGYSTEYASSRVQGGGGGKRKCRKRRRRKTINIMASGEGLNLFQQPTYDTSIVSRADTEYYPSDMTPDNNKESIIS